MNIRQALGGSLLAAIAFVLSCGNDSSPEENDGGQADTERCGDGRCGDKETRATCPSDCARAGSSGAGGAGAGGGGKGGRGGSAGKGGEAGGEEAGTGAEAATSDGGGAGIEVGSGGRGGRSDGGNGGRNTSGGTGGSSEPQEAGAAGQAGAGGESSQPRGEFGAPCESTADCIETLGCLRPDAIDGGGPPRGLCTHACDVNTDCEPYAGAGYCIRSSEAQGYCVEACTFGALGAPKCAERPDFACGPIIVRSGTTCDDLSGQGCAEGEVCLSGSCGVLASACVPLCRGDFDCPGTFCNHSNGLCQAEAPPGLPPGSECELQASGAPDPCNGFCLPVHGDVGECQALCSFSESNTGCGWSGVGTATGACLFTSSFSPPGDVALGDIGICGSLCDCNDDCEADGLYCIGDLGTLVPQIWGRRGYCRALLDNEGADVSLSDCSGASDAGN